MTVARWIAFVVVLGGSTAASGDPACKPAARVVGEPVTVAAIEPLLRERGVEVVAATTTDAPAFARACTHVKAEVTTGGAQIMVWITDADGRRAQRMAEDVEAATTVIESWARADLVDPLLAARGVIEPARFGVSAAPAPPRAPPHYLVAAGGDAGISGDGGVWAGVRAQGCGRIGAFCIGGIVRYARDLEQTGDAATLHTSRSALGATLTGERPIRRGRFTLSPGAGIGLTSVTATYDPEDELEQASTVHLRAAIAGAFEFTHSWSLRLDIAAEFSPSARARLGEPDGVDQQLAASPKWQTWFGLSLAHGGP